MTEAEKVELLSLLEERRRRLAVDDLNVYCRSIEIPGVPINDDEECEEFYPDKVTPALHHQLLNKTLMRVECGEIRRLMVFMPPGSAKSTYASVVFPTWFMGKKPGRNVICTSYGSTLAARFGRRCRAITKGEEYRLIFSAELMSDNRAADDWSLTNSSTYMAAGILAGVTGNRADGLVIDDPVKGRAEADSETIREKIWQEYITSLRTRLKPSGFIAIIQTRWHEDDLSGRILPENWNGESGWVTGRDGEKWFVLCLQAQCETDSDPLGRKRGEWLWTEWFPPEHWEQEKITQGSRNWDALYQGKPSPSAGGIFKRSWIQQYKTLPAEGIIVQSWDTGNKPEELNDPSVCTTWLVTRIGYYLIDVWRDRVDFPTLKTNTINLAIKFKPHAILIEDKASGTQLIQELHANTSLPAIGIEPDGDKIMRANNVSAMVQAGLVHVPFEAHWRIDFDSEIYSFPLSKKKDQVDSMTQFLNWQQSRVGSSDLWVSGVKRSGSSAYSTDFDFSGSHLSADGNPGRLRASSNTQGF